MGHVLSWGQISFLGATVITSFVTAIPVIGQSIVDWLWVGFIINNATLNRFFSLHFFLSFLIAEITLIHSALLHKNGSNNPLGVDSGVDKIPFYPYFFVKDLFAFFCFLFLFGTFVFYFPNSLGHPDNLNLIIHFFAQVLCTCVFFRVILLSDYEFKAIFCL